VNRTVRVPARIGRKPSGSRRFASGATSAARTSAPSSGTAAPPVGDTTMRTVTGVIDATAISTGTPAMRMGADWPRMIPPPNAMPAPAKPNCLSAFLRETRSDIRRMLTRATLMTAFPFSMGEEIA
jgi:hypothetical protein